VNGALECRSARSQDLGRSATNDETRMGQMTVESPADRSFPVLRLAPGKLGQCRWPGSPNSDILAGKLGQVGSRQPRISAPCFSAPRPAGLFSGFQIAPIESTATRPVGRMDMLETTTLLVVASPVPPGRSHLAGGFFLRRSRPTPTRKPRREAARYQERPTFPVRRRCNLVRISGIGTHRTTALARLQAQPWS
jgi:hypothetical protein